MSVCHGRNISVWYLNEDRREAEEALRSAEYIIHDVD